MTYHVIHRGPGLLAQGGADALGAPSRAFDAIVLCAEEHQIDRRNFLPTQRVIYAPLDDAELSPREALVAEMASDRVAEALRAGLKVLSTCMAGRNRSGLVSALALTKLRGWSGAYAADRVRSARPNALMNPSFLRYLSRVPAT